MAKPHSHTKAARRFSDGTFRHPPSLLLPPLLRSQWPLWPLGLRFLRREFLRWTSAWVARRSLGGYLEPLMAMGLMPSSVKQSLGGGQGVGEAG